jgi:hypothetical protein
VLKQEITYENYNGEEVTEYFYFNLSRPEMIEMEVADGGEGFSDSMDRIVKSKNAALIIEEFKKIVLKAYGERSEDGKRFIKSPELSHQFTQTAAYDELFMKLATDADFALAFCKGIIPKDLAAAVEEAEQKNETVTVQGKEVPKPPR